MTPLNWFLASRLLSQQKTQSALMVAGVAVGVGVSVFISALISGLQVNLLDTTLSSQAHITVHPLEERTRPVAGLDPKKAIRTIQRPEQRVRSISEWQKAASAIRAMPRIVAVAPAAIGAGFALRGNASRPVAVMGIDESTFEQVIPIVDHLVDGRWSLGSGEAILGVNLAQELGVGPSDRIRVQTAEGGDQLLVVRGTLDMGNRQLNERWLVVSLRTGQTLLSLGGGVTTLYVDVDGIYTAQTRAQEIAALTGLAVDDWMTTNQQLLTGLRSQSSSTDLIRICVLFAVAIGIASVLVVSVVQRSREIGILRAMGVPARTLGAVFVLQGAVVGFLGWLAGSGLAVLLVTGFSRVAVNPDGSPLFPIIVGPEVLGTAGAFSVVIGALAAVFPARRAARLDPAVAIRHV